MVNKLKNIYTYLLTIIVIITLISTLNVESIKYNQENNFQYSKIKTINNYKYIDITVEEAWNLLNNISNGIQIPIDVRTDSEWKSEHINIPKPENSRHHNFFEWDDEQILMEFMTLYDGEEIIAYCLSGGRSISAVNILVDNGFNGVIYNMLGGITEWKEAGLPTIPNQPPEEPDISGTIDGKAGGDYDYMFISNDPEDDELYYYINWSDNSNEEWIGPYDSSEELKITHNWTEQGTYLIQAKVKDKYGKESNWSIFEVTMPKLNSFLYKIFENFLEKYPYFENLLLKIINFIQFSNNIENNDEPYEGYTLFGPEYYTDVYLMDIDGKIVHTWECDYIQGLATYLTENGELFRMDLHLPNLKFAYGGQTGRVAKFDEDSNLLWEFIYSNDEHCAHHDIEPLPNGNVLIIAWESRTKEEAVAAGRNPNNIPMIYDYVSIDHIVEVEPTGPSTGNIVWEWYVWDHLIQDYDATKENYGIVEDHPELIDVNFRRSMMDWNHINSIDYNEELDQILLSVHSFNEIWVIDHSTTTEEASGHTGGNSGKGGDILYRWGNPKVYRAGDSNDQKLFGPHGANWIEEGCPGEGNILVFNNDLPILGSSSVDEIIPPINGNGNYYYVSGQAYLPKEPVWRYINESIYSNQLSNAQRLPNGNTLICSAKKAYFVEVDVSKNVVWEYYHTLLPTKEPIFVAQIHRYPDDYPGLPEPLIKNMDNSRSSRQNSNY